MKNQVKLLMLLLIIIGVIGCGKKEEIKDQEIHYKKVKFASADKKNINKIATFSGSLDSINEMEEITKTGGDVVKINYKNGDLVKKGDTILILEDQNIESAYLDSKGKVISTRSDYETQKISFKKYKTLYDEKLISEDEYLKVKNQLAGSQGMYESAYANLLKTKKDYDDLSPKAKINGEIANLDFKLYENVKKDKSLFKVVDNNELRILGGISSKNIINLKNGAVANIYVEDLKGSEKGTLYEINPIANPITRKFDIKIKIDNKDGKYKQGMFAKIELYTGIKEGVIVPKKAIIIEELQTYVFVGVKEKVNIETNGKKKEKEMLIGKKIKIELGISEGETQEVISSELKDKNLVIISGQYSLNDGDYIEEEK